MERESFEDQQVALLLNNNFISIKIDREELPGSLIFPSSLSKMLAGVDKRGGGDTDVDTIYMNAAQSMGISGGWPLNVHCAFICCIADSTSAHTSS